VVHVHRQHKPAWYEEGLDPHRWCIAFVEVYLALSVTWNTRIVGEVVWNKHIALESARWHAIPLKLLVGVWERGLVERYLRGPEYAVQLV
jgi:hypothetical protein